MESVSIPTWTPLRGNVQNAPHIADRRRHIRMSPASAGWRQTSTLGDLPLDLEALAIIEYESLLLQEQDKGWNHAQMTRMNPTQTRRLDWTEFSQRLKKVTQKGLERTRTPPQICLILEMTSCRWPDSEGRTRWHDEHTEGNDLHHKQFARAQCKSTLVRIGLNGTSQGRCDH